ncbi:unnamed protein product [Polarella glacialis]|uniref:Uncharacterized protein n=1 Tax=Polarella glacialis TaxID=89957 RepID=A0A813F435_POLGL|nr:unnamed protein product [Polarella glacialis]
MTPCAIVFELMKLYEPGGNKEKQDTLEKLERPTAATTAEEAMKQLRLWEQRLRRLHELKVSIPDPSRLAAALRTITDSIISKDLDFLFRAQTARASVELDVNPTHASVDLYLKFVKAEMAAKEVLSLPAAAQKQTPVVKALEVTAGQEQADKGKGKGKGKGKWTAQERSLLPCTYFDKPAGCSKGRDCGYLHARLAPADKRCFNCGSTEHIRTDCTNNNNGAKFPPKPKVAAASVAQEVDQQAAAKQDNAPTHTAASSPVQASETPSSVSSASASAASATDLTAEINKMISRMLSTPTAAVAKTMQVVTLGMMKSSCQERGLLDSGASHAVRAQRQTDRDIRPCVVELACGQRKEMMMTGEGTVIGSGATSPIVPMLLARQSCGIHFSDTEDGALKLTHPVLGELDIYTCNGVLEISAIAAEFMINEIEQQQQSRCAKVTPEEKLLEHKASGHRQYDRNCSECLGGAMRDRMHRRTGEAELQTLSADVVGPFAKADEHNYKYFLQAVFTIASQEESVEEELPELLGDCDPFVIMQEEEPTTAAEVLLKKTSDWSSANLEVLASQLPAFAALPEPVRASLVVQPCQSKTTPPGLP